MNKIIVTDMDDVLVHLLCTWIEELNTRYNLNVTCNDIIDWDMSKAFPTVPKSQLYGILHESQFWNKVKPNEDAVTYLTKLHEEGYRILVATAAHFNTISVKLTNALFPYFEFLIYKDIIMIHDKKLLQCDYIVDDYHENLRGSKAIKFLMDAPYNKNCDKSTYNYRIKSFKELYDIIHKLDDVGGA